MDSERIIKKLNIDESPDKDAKQLAVLQFLKKVKFSREREPLIAELKAFMECDRESGENIFVQLVHSDLPPVRRYALDFVDKTGFDFLKPHLKNLMLVEDDEQSLKICFRLAASTLDRSELPAFFDVVSAKKSVKSDMMLAFLETECARLNIDSKRMLENARALREQERKKRASKYEKSSPDEGMFITDEIFKNIKKPAVKKYALAALIAFAILMSCFRVYIYVKASGAINGSLALIDEYKEEEAARILREFIADYPDNSLALFHLHRIYCENYNIIEANEALGKIMSVNDDARLIALAEVRNSVFSGDLSASADFFAKSAQNDASDDARYLKARHEYLNAKNSRATPNLVFENIYTDLEILYKKNISGYRPYILNTLVSVAAEAGLFEKARPYFLEVLKTSGSKDYKAQLACAYYSEKAGNYEQAVSLYERVARGPAPDIIHAYASSTAGRLCLKIKKYKMALEFYLKLKAVSPERTDAYLGLIEAYGALNDVGGLNAAYSEALAKFESDKMIHYNYAVIRLRLGDFEDAAKIFKKVIELDPEMADAYYSRARALSALADKFEAHSMPWNTMISEAVDYYRKSVQINPAFHEAYISLGTIDMAKSPPDYDGAAKNFGSALKIEPKSREALLNMLTLGRLKKDKKIMDKYRALIKEAFADDEEIMARTK